MDIKYRGDVIAELLKSPAVQQDLRRRADRIAAAAGPGMEASVRVGRTRARGSVITATAQARDNEARNRALTRALDAGRL
jgi:tRNA A37 threonylcarbamoyltransferase TsaD